MPKKLQPTYNGWKNYNTWNVVLTMQNDYALYLSACLFIKAYDGAKPYRDWVKIAGLTGKKTMDGCQWDADDLAYGELNSMMKGMVN
jgi:hypothetical protein|tara:strand:- start:2513 stop:2773 length:261 start_codon:yes stop_codon:yes gene_type:complete